MNQLKRQLKEMNGKGYKAYKDLRGTYEFPEFSLHIDHIQSDPFASPSRIRVCYLGNLSFIKKSWLEQSHLKIALEDMITRLVYKELEQLKKSKDLSISKKIQIDRPGQEILLSTSCLVQKDSVELRLSVELPAQGRRILGEKAIELLCLAIPQLIKRTFNPFDLKKCEEHLQLAQHQYEIRHFLKEKQYIAFIANGSILPRKSGVSQEPLPLKAAKPFQSPSSMEIEIPLSGRSPIKGLAIPIGITLIVGGGYHGKSTLLQAIERGVYDHIEGDGREWVISEQTACKIRSEDGRRVEMVNISPFISKLPFAKNTERFSTDNASGSTSQAANIAEALELESNVLLIDEDTSATNFMIRDNRMQQLVAKEKEPITPYVDKIRQLYEEHEVSTILVLGGTGDYFDVADHVIMMDEYVPKEVTSEAKKIAQAYKQSRLHEGGLTFGEVSCRILRKEGFSSQKGKKEKADGRGTNYVFFGSETIDLSLVEQLVHPSQTNAIANILRYLSIVSIDEKTTLNYLLEELFLKIEHEGLDFLSPFKGHPGNMALPRKYEVAAAINRLRTLNVKVK
ncbi:ABC-ATPase domain-containing protein [Halalkalibacter urbisdiaboli]|uniref:ABC-ATPase domain-containing protein n=1 Tax=Halalkalibacter urbisdiaboli TaxID=1960589 RepID=UPI000B44752A|nr:ABC-ATPase domain-containing protein [Halalkalibacter urbisdiaboli]